MDKPTEEQGEEFWKGCGISFVPKKENMIFGNVKQNHWDLRDHLLYPDGTRHLEYPSIDLNNLWKYAIPQLCKEYPNWRSILHDWVDQCTGDYKKDTLALFWALWEVKEENE